MIKREKKYQIKEISRDGLLRNVKRFGHEVLYDTYDTEEEAWTAIEKEWDYPHGDWQIAVTVVELWVVRLEEEDLRAIAEGKEV